VKNKFVKIACTIIWLYVS